jgi:gluconokinase
MIIFVGGLPGAGKSTIAKGLAEHFAIPYNDVDEFKKVVYPQDPDFERNIREGIPFSDELRLEVFRRLFLELEELLKNHRHVVVDEVMHKREIRRFVYDETTRLGVGFIVIWVQANEEVILERLGGKQRKGHILSDPLPLHRSFAREFENYERSVIVCPNNATPRESIADLVRLIKNVGMLDADQIPSK